MVVVTLNDMNHVFSWAEKSSVYTSLYAELLPQGLWVPFNQGVVSSRLVDVHLIVLEGFYKKMSRDFAFFLKMFYCLSNKKTLILP